MSGDQETLQKQLEEALEGMKRAEEEKLKEREARIEAEEREKKLEEQLKARENLEGELKRMREKKDSEHRMRSTGILEEGSIKLEVEVDKVGKEFIYSSYTDIAGLPFRIGCRTEGSMLAGYLCCNDNAKSNASSALVDFSVQLASPTYPCTKSARNLFLPPAVSMGFEVCGWPGITRPMYSVATDGRFTIEAYVKVIWCLKNPVDFTFASPDPQLSDLTLLVGGKKIHTNRWYLAHYSEYFKAVCCSKFAEKDKKEIELEEIDAKEFEEMLEVIYPQRSKVTAATVIGLLKMADFFDVPVVTKKCSNFLKKSVDFSLTSKLLLTEEFRLPELEYHLVESLKSVNDTKPIMDSPDFSKFSLILQNTLLQKHIKLRG